MPSPRFISFLLVLGLAACTAPGNTPAPTNTAAPSPTSTPPPRSTNTPIPTATATPEPGFAIINPVDDARLLFIPAGEFQMGREDGKEGEQPAHTVFLDAYWLYETEVTNAQFARFVAETGYRTDIESAESVNVFIRNRWQEVVGAYWERPTGPDSDLTGLENHPVVFMNWNDAAAYCEWAGVRLPTEAEWEKAARGTDGRAYPWGDTWNPRYANSWRDGDGYTEQTAPVGSYPEGASPYGILDMAGNVWEWVADWYRNDYYANSPASNPGGPDGGRNRVLRGGSWFHDEFYLHSARRAAKDPAYTTVDYGFRCASSTAP